MQISMVFASTRRIGFGFRDFKRFLVDEEIETVEKSTTMIRFLVVLLRFLEMDVVFIEHARQCRPNCLDYWY